MKNDLESLFREAERLRTPPELWPRIAERIQGGGASSPDMPLSRDAAPGTDAARRAERLEIRYLRAAAVALAAGLLGLAAFGLLRRPADPLLREASAAAPLSATAAIDSEIIDPELLGWQADLGNYELVADEAEEAL